jgi:hypothetical protein
MEAIEAWLKSSTDYWQGVKLFEQYGNDAFQLSQFKRAAHSYNFKKLTQALSALVISKPKSVVADDLRTAAQQTEKVSPTIQKEATLAAVLNMMDERRLLHTELWHKTSQTDRKVVAFRILSISDKISKYYSGEEEPEKEAEPLPTDKADLVTRRNNNRAYISKNKHKESKKAEVARREEENNQIEIIINADS